MMIQAQYFQTLLQAKIYLNFVLRNSPFSAPRKVDKNIQRMVTKRYYYRCEKGCQATSFWTILRSETSIDIPFDPKISVKCVKRGTASSRIVSVVLALNILRNDFLVRVSKTPDFYILIVDVNNVLTFCDFTQSYWKLSVRASAWMTKGNTVWIWKQMFKHATTWHHIPHHQKCAYSAAHTIHGS